MHDKSPRRASHRAHGSKQAKDDAGQASHTGPVNTRPLCVHDTPRRSPPCRAALRNSLSLCKMLDSGRDVTTFHNVYAIHVSLRAAAAFAQRV